jgi:hypothetical protein
MLGRAMRPKARRPPSELRNAESWIPSSSKTSRDPMTPSPRRRMSSPRPCGRLSRGVGVVELLSSQISLKQEGRAYRAVCTSDGRRGKVSASTSPAK